MPYIQDPNELSKDERPGYLRTVEIILASIAGAIILSIIIGTIIVFASGKAFPDSGKPETSSAIPDGTVIFDKIGTIRTTTTDDPPATLVVSVAFAYQASDIRFGEELVQKTDDMKSAVLSFFSSKSAEELSASFEGTIRAELRDTLNALLSLGKIEEILFPEFQVIQ